FLLVFAAKHRESRRIVASKEIDHVWRRRSVLFMERMQLASESPGVNTLGHKKTKDQVAPKVIERAVELIAPQPRRGVAPKLAQKECFLFYAVDPLTKRLPRLIGYLPGHIEPPSVDV